jgi:hypothetical protein
MRRWYLAINDDSSEEINNSEVVRFTEGSNVTLTRNGNSIAIAATDTNNYLNSITRTNYTLTFSVLNAADQTYTFGSNAFTSTDIPVDTSDLTNDAKFITVAGVVDGSGITTSVNNNTNTVTVSHAVTSNQVGTSNIDGNVIQNVTLDTYGHVTSLASTDLDTRYLRKDVNTSTNSTITAYDFQLSSDKSLKENVESLNKNIDVDWVEYNFKDKPEEKRFGVIAQDLEEKHPEFVNDSDNGKTVSYIDLLVAKIAELERRIIALENGCK